MKSSEANPDYSTNANADIVTSMKPKSLLQQYTKSSVLNINVSYVS